MSNEQTRDAFEAWAIIGFSPALDCSMKGNNYAYITTHGNWLTWQAATLAAAPHAETEAWLIEWGSGAERRHRVYMHNAIGDYRHLYKDATVHELVKRAALPPTGTPQATPQGKP